MATKKNMSSGAEKVEKLANEKKNCSNAKKSCSGSCKTGEKSGTVKSQSATKKSSAKSQLTEREEKRLAHAKLVAEKKQARLEKRLEHRRKRAEHIAEMKEKRAERRALKKERRDYLKSESAEARRERIAAERQAKLEAKQAKHEAYLAEKKAKREHELKLKAQRRAEKNDKRHAPGFGGWLAAVISLGVTSLALGTIVTFGWINMDNMQMNMAGASTQSLYELNSIIDNLDADLSRVRASTSTGDRVRTLTEIAIESETAETVLERMPVELTMTEQLASFLNKVSDSAKGMIYDLARGGELSPSQLSTLNYMYSTNRTIKEAMNELVSSTNTMDMLNAMRDKQSILGESFTTLQNNTFETPKGIQDGPFADSVKKTNPRALEGLEEITPQTAEELAWKYFADYKLTAVRCTGEAAGNALTAYNLCLDTPDGQMWAQISKLGGKVIMFDSYKDCSQNNFSVDRCEAIAQDFLSSLGYDFMKAVWTSENGSTCNLNFAPVQDGVILYPDLIKVKVCEERGIVTGIEAMNYVLNHSERTLSDATISIDRARENVSGDMTIDGQRLTLIPLNGGEILCYEFVGSYDGNEYYVYVDATTGEEMEVLTVIGTAQGRALM